MAQCDDCKANKVCDHNRFGFENCGNFIPADVVPKSEFDKLLISETTEIHIAMEKLVKVRTEHPIFKAIEEKVVREIFEEIEEALFNNHDLDLYSDYPTPHYYEELKDEIAELKKKYTEEQPWEN